jgi:hypothetical protein
MTQRSPLAISLVVAWLLIASCASSRAPSTDPTVAMRESSLVLQTSTLSPVSKDAFVGEYMGVVRFSRDQRGTVSGFTLNRQAARGVRFERSTR